MVSVHKGQDNSNIALVGTVISFTSAPGIPNPQPLINSTSIRSTLPYYNVILWADFNIQHNTLDPYDNMRRTEAGLQTLKYTRT